MCVLMFVKGVLIRSYCPKLVYLELRLILTVSTIMTICKRYQSPCVIYLPVEASKRVAR